MKVFSVNNVLIRSIIFLFFLWPCQSWMPTTLLCPVFYNYELKWPQSMSRALHGTTPSSGKTHITYIQPTFDVQICALLEF